MSLPTGPTQWTITLAPVPPATPVQTKAVLKAKARRAGLAALALLASYWLGAATGEPVTAAPPAPAHSVPATVTVQPGR